MESLRGPPAQGACRALWPKAGICLPASLLKVAPGQQILVKWRGHPIFIVNRPPDALKELQQPDLVAKLSGAQVGEDAAADAVRKVSAHG